MGDRQYNQGGARRRMRKDRHRPREEGFSNVEGWRGEIPRPSHGLDFDCEAKSSIQRQASIDEKHLVVFRVQTE